MTVKFVENTESDIPCPVCGVNTKMIVKTNKLNNHQFLGCPNYPSCNETKEIPEAWKMRAAGQQELF